MNNMFASIFGESPATKNARDARNSAFQDMLNTRRQAAQQDRTDNVRMARYNALGNVITSMAQLGGWAAGGGTSNVQKYDDRQYLDAFNRAVKAADDIRNVGSAEAEYRFKLADEDLRRQQSLEDSERQQARMLERQEQAAQAREERDRKLHEQRMELEEQKADARRALEEYKATHRVSRKGTGGMSVEDRILLKEMDTYKEYVKIQTANRQPYETFEQWLDKNGYQVDRRYQSTGSGGGSLEHADGL